MKPRRILLLAVVGALCLTALIAIMALLTGNFGETEGKILATTGGFALASLFAMRGTILLDQNRHRELGWTVVALSALAFLLELKVVWIDEGDSPVTWKALAITAGFAGALGQIATSLARRRPSDPSSLRPLAWAAGGCALTVELLIAIAAIEEVDDSGFYRLLAAIFVLDVLLVALESVVRRLGTPAPVPANAAPFICVLADGRRIRPQAHDRDVPTAVAAALREFTARGQRVRAIELDPDSS
jgi:hypothetical protein